jgi:ATP-binding cassette subfamily F protein uup
VRKPANTRPRKLSFKETKEWEGIEPAINAAEEEIARIEQIFGEPDFHRQFGQKTDELTAELEAAKARVAQLYTRWEELEKIRIGTQD